MCHMLNFQWVIPEKNPQPPPPMYGVVFLTPPLTWISWSLRPPSCMDSQDKSPPSRLDFPEKKGVKVNQLFSFSTSIITQNNRDLTWNYLTLARWVWVRVKMCQAFQTLRCNNVATVFSIFFSFSAVKGPVKELKLSFTSGEKNVNKIFPLLSGSESAKVSPN